MYLITGKPYLIFNASVSTSSILTQRLGEYTSKVSGSKATQRKQTTHNEFKDSMLPSSEKLYKKYSSVQACIHLDIAVTL